MAEYPSSVSDAFLRAALSARWNLVDGPFIRASISDLMPKSVLPVEQRHVDLFVLTDQSLGQMCSRLHDFVDLSDCESREAAWKKIIPHLVDDDILVRSEAGGTVLFKLRLQVDVPWLEPHVSLISEHVALLLKHARPQSYTEIGYKLLMMQPKVNEAYHEEKSSLAGR